MYVVRSVLEGTGRVSFTFFVCFRKNRATVPYSSVRTMKNTSQNLRLLRTRVTIRCKIDIIFANVLKHFVQSTFSGGHSSSPVSQILQNPVASRQTVCFSLSFSGGDPVWVGLYGWGRFDVFVGTMVAAVGAGEAPRSVLVYST